MSSAKCNKKRPSRDWDRRNTMAPFDFAQGAEGSALSAVKGRNYLITSLSLSLSLSLYVITDKRARFCVRVGVVSLREAVHTL
ncbi:MAG: hypothetical protein LBC84_08175 [Prevotellaceae bacterium]|jgi:hypothetical protein|nr:hypothetical protein [Prevotellaceae bacterium]